MKKNNSGYLLRRIIAIPIIAPILVNYMTSFLEHKGFINSGSGYVIIQTFTFILIGAMIIVIALLLDAKEKNDAKVQIQIQQNEMIFRKFAENIDIVFYTTAPDLSKILYVSPAYERIWGRNAESLYKNPKEWYESIHPEDQKATYEAFF